MLPQKSISCESGLHAQSANLPADKHALHGIHGSGYIWLAISGDWIPGSVNQAFHGEYSRIPRADRQRRLEQRRDVGMITVLLPSAAVRPSGSGRSLCARLAR